jgi:hypothetical protein
MHADVSVYRDALSFYEEIVGGFRIFPLTEAGLLAAFRLPPIEQLCARLNTHMTTLLGIPFWPIATQVRLDYSISFPLVKLNRNQFGLSWRSVVSLHSLAGS